MWEPDGNFDFILNVFLCTSCLYVVYTISKNDIMKFDVFFHGEGEYFENTSVRITAYSFWTYERNVLIKYVVF